MPQIRPSDDFVPSFNPDTGVARLTVPTVMPEDVGNYTVLAENPFGRDQNTANLIIVEGEFVFLLFIISCITSISCVILKAFSKSIMTFLF